MSLDEMIKYLILVVFLALALGGIIYFLIRMGIGG